MAEKIVPVFVEKTVPRAEWIKASRFDDPHWPIKRSFGVLFEARQVDMAENITYKVCTTYPGCSPCTNYPTCPIVSLVEPDITS